MARRKIWSQAVFHELPRHLYGEFVAMRRGAQPWVSSAVPGSARRRRRWSAANGTGYSRGYFSSASAWTGVCPLRNHCNHGTDDWADARRMDHIQLFLALDQIG